MPGDKNISILVYGTAASLAAVALIYVFSPSFVLDNSSSSANQRRKGVVGLVNTANDCFINSVLQALAGLPELRVYLIHRTKRAGELGEFQGPRARTPFLSGALKKILDDLNERPIHRKIISARPFLAVLENVFRRQISRAQQDAQEFLQVVAETIAEEYRTMKALERERNGSSSPSTAALEVPTLGRGETPNHAGEEGVDDEVKGFPFEGVLESEIECTKCHYKTKPTFSTFVVLTVPVPQKSSATLSECIDSVISTEYIDDYQCDRCKLQNAIDIFSKKLSGSTSPSNRETLKQYVHRLEQALDDDPEKPPADIPLPSAPRTRIAKRTWISNYPNVLAVHLSRSIYDLQFARRNSCKVSFPEKLAVGGLLERQPYKLHCVVTHKGRHDSGHYECFRRQIVYPPPFSTPSPRPSTPIISATPIVSITPSDKTSLLQGSSCGYGTANGQSQEQGSGNPSRTATRSPSLLSLARDDHISTSSPPNHETEDIEAQIDSPSTEVPLDGKRAKHHQFLSFASSPSSPTSTPVTYTSDEMTSGPTLVVPSSSTSQTQSRSPSPTRSITPTVIGPSNSKTEKYKPPDTPYPGPFLPKKAKKKHSKLDNRWWRISDDKIKETKTDDVLDQQKEVYLLFYQKVEKESIANPKL